ncbi:uncharacterized protein AB675_808 [Cyphellophora attinorum]|uniref:Putative membrane protein n=1 Tax=Cyphellophora attinorum TaxID=1664694 RepID=A0A0N1HH79_9EURO|nr:uncharacterized protein AB675_808 [Phialophora attinorum]KPI45792.1 putative membrane protein [Phialophora attinorum]
MPSAPGVRTSTGTDDDVARDQAPLLSDTDHDTSHEDGRANKAEHDSGMTRPTLTLQVGSTPQLTRRPSFIDKDEQTPAAGGPSSTKDDAINEKAAVTWSSLPQKAQLAVLTLARLSEPLSERSLSAYMFYQLRWFSQMLWWGRAADHPSIGRKRVLLVGLCGTFIASLGVGFSTSFGFALFCRTIAGLMNGNIGVMRTMISEMIREKKYQSRAFLLLPMCFNVGVIIGPIMGGFLADASFGIPKFPYALPNLVSGTLILMSAGGIVLFLDETHEARRNKPDYGRKLGRMITKLLSRTRSQGYTPLATHSAVDSVDLEQHPQSSLTTPGTATKPSDPNTTPSKNVPFRSIFTKNVTLTILAHHLLAFHVSSFNALIFLLLPATRSNNANAHLPFSFTGGLGLTTEQVGMATAIIGVIGLPLQILLYPPLDAKLGTVTGYKLFLPFSIAAYICLPFLVILPDNKFLIWPCLTLIFAMQVMSRTFALPSGVILINNCSPSRKVLGTIHGFAQSASSAARTVGPVFGGWLLGWGLAHNCMGLVWWVMAGVAAANWALLWTVYEGDGSGGRANYNRDDGDELDYDDLNESGKFVIEQLRWTMDYWQSRLQRGKRAQDFRDKVEQALNEAAIIVLQMEARRQSMLYENAVEMLDPDARPHKPPRRLQ